MSNIEELCCGNFAAMQFCKVLWDWCQWIDDTLDRDKTWLPELAIKTNLNAIVVFSENEFFQRHRDVLGALVMLAARAQGDSIEWAKRKSRKDRRAADILKSLYHEIFWQVAFFSAVEAGKDGWEHLTNMTRKYRAFDYDYKN
jgi:hypothetical protein